VDRTASEVAVVGAGVIGLTVALRLASEGREVVVLDPEPPGSGASYGNAGTIADYAVQPVGTPAVLKSLPSLLFDRTSPLSVRRDALPSLAPWLLRFARQSLPGPARSNAVALAGLLADAGPLWRELAAAVGGADILRQTGCLYLYDSPAAVRAAAGDLAFRRSLGVAVETVSAAEVTALEPALPPVAGAALFPGALFLTDPGAMMARLAAAGMAAGVRLVAARVERLDREAGGVALTGPGLHLTARHAVIAAGARSKLLARRAGDRVPLDTERGYHAEWDMEAPLLSRPSAMVARGFYLCPMAGRMRAAGTVELGGIDAPPSPHRIARLVEGARGVFPQLGPPDRTWMGLRPSIPDSLPVIGASRGGRAVIHAFGHGHLGVTLAPATARIVADLVAGRQPSDTAAPCSPMRFG
jgi:D-amino-acid dehydrogenase